MTNKHTHHSSFREKLIEHLFVGQLLEHSWKQRGCELEVSHPDVDNSGYDLITEEGGVIRHIQLKTSARTSRTAQQKIQLRLGSKPSGCVVWIRFDAESMELGPYLFFGAAPGEPMASIEQHKTAKHTKANAQGVKTERKHLKVVAKGEFQSLDSIQELYQVLFGAPAEEDPRLSTT